MQRTVTDAETSRDVIANRRPKTYIRVSGWLWDNLETICQVCVLATGARVAFLGRNAAIGADGLSYLDVASAYLQHNWQTAVNGYWSPLYSWLLGVAMFLVKPSASLEPLLVRGVNFLIFALAVYTFRDCWHALASWSRRGQPGTTIAEVAPKGWILFGYALFVATVPWHVESVAPDILVAVVVFATSTLLFKMNDGRRGIAADISLGIVLAIGYYAKAILLYFAIFVILTLLLRRKSNRRLGTVVTITIFSMLVLPYVFALSHTLGRWTAGDSGKLNYAWFVDGSPTKSWMIPHGAPLPFFPGPQIASNVPAFRVPVLPGVTYAPWYDAARFATGSQPRFSLRGEIRQVAINLRELQFDLLITGAPLLVTLLVFLSYSPRSSLSRLLSSWIFWLPPLAVLSM